MADISLNKKHRGRDTQMKRSQRVTRTKYIVISHKNKIHGYVQARIDQGALPPLQPTAHRMAAAEARLAKSKELES